MKYLENIKTPGEVYTFGVLLKISLRKFSFGNKGNINIYMLKEF